MTQDALAEALFVSRQTVSNYETDKTRPDIDTLIKLADLLDTDVTTLIYGEPVPPERKRAYRRLVVSSTVFLLLLAAALVMQPLVNRWRVQDFILSPSLWMDLMLKPCLYMTLGWTVMQAALLLLRAAPLRQRAAKILHTSLWAALALLAAILVPTLILCTQQDITMQAYTAVHDYAITTDTNTTFSFLLSYLLRYPALFLLPGAALNLTGPPRRMKKQTAVNPGIKGSEK